MKRMTTVIVAMLMNFIAQAQITPIAVIQEDPSYIGRVVTIEGVVMIEAGRLNCDYLKAFIQDFSGKGIQIWD